MKLSGFCEAEKVDSLEELTTEKLDQFRAAHGIKPSTAARELGILRMFFRFCARRKWVKDNPATEINLPRNVKPNEVAPFTTAEIRAILLACDRIGMEQYERLRARAMVLTLRYTALRIGDVSMLSKDRISGNDDKWRIFIRTEKSGQPVFLPVPPDLKLALDAVPRQWATGTHDISFGTVSANPRPIRPISTDVFAWSSVNLVCGAHTPTDSATRLQPSS